MSELIENRTAIIIAAVVLFILFIALCSILVRLNVRREKAKR